MADKVLVVDDDLDSLKLIGLMLQRNGYEVIAASAGSQALQKATSERPNLIILDVMMPDMSGLEVCRRLRKHPDTQSIPIIMFTAKTLIDDKVAGFEAGADDYLTKPTHPAELADRVKKMLARSGGPPKPAAPSSGATIGVLGVKGGVGTSTIAVNIAASRQMAGDNPILADIRLGQGSTGLALGLGRAQGMANVLSRPIEDIHMRNIEAEMSVHSSGMRMLLSSARPTESTIAVTPEKIREMLRQMRTMGKPVVADLGCGLTPLVRKLLSDLDHMVIVLDPVSVTLNMARDLFVELDAVRQDPSRTHAVIVTRAATSSPPSWNDIEQILGREIRGMIALASELALHAQQEKVPIVLYQPTAIASSQMIKLADDISARLRLA